MSSVMIHTCGWRSMTSVMAFMSAHEQVAPVGLLGKFSSSHLVRGVIAASSASACSRKPLFCGHGTNTGVAPANLAMSV